MAKVAPAGLSVKPLSNPHQSLLLVRPTKGFSRASTATPHTAGTLGVIALPKKNSFLIDIFFLLPIFGNFG
ncbi:MAG: hypothetical protein WD607_01085 [Candidatus Paceibacterota bacterium]